MTEDPETVGTGRVLVEAGLTYARDRTFSGSGLTGDLLEVPQVGLSIGVGPIAEIQIDGGLYRKLTHHRPRARRRSPDLLDITGDTTTSVDDMVVGAKIRLVGEKADRPAFGLRLVTKLPNASNESGLGLNTMDFFATLLVGRTVGSTRFVGNAGLGILTDPTEARAADRRAAVRLLDCAGGGRRARGGRRGERPRAVLRGVSAAGRRIARGVPRRRCATRVDPDASTPGCSSAPPRRIPSFGFTVGYTHVFNAFSVSAALIR